MGFLDHNANFGLLVLVAVIAISLVGVTLYFQEKFDDVNQEYDAKVKSLEEATENLVENQDKLEALNEDLSLKEKRETTLATNYESVTEENEALKKEVDELNDKLDETKDKLRDANDEIGDLDVKIQRFEVDLENCQQV